MADDGEDEPTVTLGAKQAVEGAPLARVSARLMWGIEKSAIVEREGETTIRTPSGPQKLAALLGAVDQTYFATRQEFEDAVNDVVDDGPIPAKSDGEPEESADEAKTDGDDANTEGETAKTTPEDDGEAGTAGDEEADDDAESDDGEEIVEDETDEGDENEA